MGLLGPWWAEGTSNVTWTGRIKAKSIQKVHNVPHFLPHASSKRPFYILAKETVVCFVQYVQEPSELNSYTHITYWKALSESEISRELNSLRRKICGALKDFHPGTRVTESASAHLRKTTMEEDAESLLSQKLFCKVKI